MLIDTQLLWNGITEAGAFRKHPAFGHSYDRDLIEPAHVFKLVSSKVSDRLESLELALMTVVTKRQAPGRTWIEREVICL